MSSRSVVDHVTRIECWLHQLLRISLSGLELKQDDEVGGDGGGSRHDHGLVEAEDALGLDAAEFLKAFLQHSESEGKRHKSV